jgi:hypothetical protein
MKNTQVEITKPMIGICYMQVCAVKDATDEEILEVANAENPSGTSNGWSTVAREDHEDERMRPVTCDGDENRKHFILIC